VTRASSLSQISEAFAMQVKKMEYNQKDLEYGEETFFDLLKGQNLVKADGKLKKANEVVCGKKLIILYFSASWCQACTEFTPTLRGFYDYVSSRSVEIIYVSSDGSPEDMFKYMKNSHGNWYAVEYGSDLAIKLTQKYDVWGIQCSSGLVVLSENGSVITKNGRNQVSEMGPEVIYTWSDQISRTRVPYYKRDETSDSEEDETEDGICTFSQTGTTFRPQHWYYCHTCNFETSEGVCSVCVKTCHSNHDVSYAQYSPFFCDCGAKGEDFCQSLIGNSNKKSDAQNFCDFVNRKNSVKTLKMKRKKQKYNINFIYEELKESKKMSHVTKNTCGDQIESSDNDSDFETSDSDVSTDDEIESQKKSDVIEKTSEDQIGSSDIDSDFETSDSEVSTNDEIWEKPKKTRRHQTKLPQIYVSDYQNRFKILEITSA